MKIECIAQCLTDDLMKSFGVSYPKNQDYHVSIGRTYTVYGLDFVSSETLHLCYVYYVNDYGHLSSSPLSLFKITDERPSSIWVTRMLNQEIVAIRPPSFFQEYYLDDLSEGIKETVNDFEEVKTLIESEFS